MGKRDIRVNEPIDVLYQAPNKASGETVVGEVYLPSGVKDSNFPDFTLTERGGSGTYVGEFTPDTVGEWQVIIHLDNGDGQVTKRYSVGEYDVTGVGVAVDALDTKVDVLDIELGVVNGKVDDLDTQLGAVEIKVDNIITSVGSAGSPPMVS